MIASINVVWRRPISIAWKLHGLLLSWVQGWRWRRPALMRYVQLRWQDGESDRIGTRRFGEASGRSNGPFWEEDQKSAGGRWVRWRESREHRREERGNGQRRGEKTDRWVDLVVRKGDDFEEKEGLFVAQSFGYVLDFPLRLISS